jgi:hypothetical protein
VLTILWFSKVVSNYRLNRLEQSLALARARPILFDHNVCSTLVQEWRFALWQAGPPLQLCD